MEAAESEGADPDANILFVNVAGNEGGDGSQAQTPQFTGTDDRLLVVAAADGDSVAEYSSRGDREDSSTWPDLTAPGCMLTPTIPPLGADQTLINTVEAPEDSPCIQPRETQALNYVATGYALVSVTSLATPFVSGVGAMMFEVNPQLQAEDARYLLTRTADPFLPSEDLDGDGDVSPAEFRTQHGYKAEYGLVNATGAVAAAHYMLLHPTATPQDAVDCFQTGNTDEGRTVLNPDGGYC
jgi:subtilisin family serine protease